MKSLILLLLLTACLLCGTVCNAIYINDVSNCLLGAIEALPQPESDDCIVQIRDLIGFWESNIDTVRLSVSYTVADRITEQAAVLEACAVCGDRFGFYSALELLRDAVEDMRRLEQVSVGNLL
ncbi:MAG: hypothetical protein IJW49_05915 [Clostridia bacterium]|nr:hypothetical protein [Clostridia bacterium]